jgi:hypothetical protein
MLHQPLTPIADDTEDAPWMVMGTPQFSAVTDLYFGLQGELEMRQPRPFLASMLPIRYRPIPGGDVEQLAPDLLVAWVPVRDRSSYDVEREGVPPAFVFEVVSPESRVRDLDIKPARYERMGVEEYALYAPPRPDGSMLLQPQLQGYRRAIGSEDFVRWDADEQGRLFSEVLDLWLVVRGGELRVQRPDGSLLLTPAEQRKALREAEAHSGN